MAGLIESPPKTTEREDEIKSLKQQLSQKTNEILQLQDEKEELELRVDQLNKTPVEAPPTVKQSEDDEKVRELELRLMNKAEQAA